MVSEDRRRLFGHQGLGGYSEGVLMGELAGNGDVEDEHRA